MQYSYLKEKGAFAWDPAAQRFRIDYDTLEAGIRDLTAKLIHLQGDGDYEGTKAFFERYAQLDDEARIVLDNTAHIPTDIQPDYPDRI